MRTLLITTAARLSLSHLTNTLPLSALMCGVFFNACSVTLWMISLSETADEALSMYRKEEVGLCESCNGKLSQSFDTDVHNDREDKSLVCARSKGI